jgi:hypothetical protein
MEPEARRSAPGGGGGGAGGGGAAGGGGGRREATPLSDEHKAAIRAGLETYLKPWLKA